MTDNKKIYVKTNVNGDICEICSSPNDVNNWIATDDLTVDLGDSINELGDISKKVNTGKYDKAEAFIFCRRKLIENITLPNERWANCVIYAAEVELKPEDSQKMIDYWKVNK